MTRSHLIALFPRILSRSGSLLVPCLLLCLGLARLPAMPEGLDPVISVTGGLIRGRLLPDGHGSVFKGIPFAQPPVGVLRWREPMPVVAWAGTRDAEASGPPAVQATLGWDDKARVLGPPGPPPVRVLGGAAPGEAEAPGPRVVRATLGWNDKAASASRED